MSHFATNKTYGIYKVLRVLKNFEFEVECQDCKSVSIMDDRIFKNYKHCHCKNEDRNNNNIIGRIIKNYKIVDIIGNKAICKCTKCDKIKEESLFIVLDNSITQCMCNFQKIDIESLIGQKYGRWTVDSKSEKPQYVNVTCECGTKGTVKTCYLLNGESKSCGCLRKERKNKIEFAFSKVIRGFIKIGYLTILETVQRPSKSGKKIKSWKVRCDCGKELIRSETTLRNINNKHPLSCGCSYKKQKS